MDHWFHKIMDDPFVFFIKSGPLDTLLHRIQNVYNNTGGRTCYILVQPSWCLIEHFEAICQLLAELKPQAPQLNFIFMAPNIETLNLYRGVGIQALNISSSCLIDDEVFRPVICDKIYDVIHIAQASPFKRHWLAYELDNIAVISYDSGISSDLSILSGYKNIKYSNFTSDGNKVVINRRLNHAEVADLISQSRVGLILSSTEGQNRSSVEYLLCGIPIVTTPSKGGRETFYDSRHVLICEPDSDAVKKHVKILIDRNVEPLEVRSSVYNKIKEHRKRLLVFLESISNKNILTNSGERLWIPEFFGALYNV